MLSIFVMQTFNKRLNCYLNDNQTILFKACVCVSGFRKILISVILMCIELQLLYLIK